MTTTYATSTVTYRKTKSGEWVAFGPVAFVREGYVEVTKKSGERKSELVQRVGRPFTVDGREMVYGYLAPRSTATPARTGTRSSSGGHSCEACGARSAHYAYDMSGIGGYACYTCDDGSLSLA